MNQFQIPFFGLQRQYKNLREEILDVTDRVLMTGQLMSGTHTHEFEAWLAKKNHSKYAITCHSGTQALEIIALYENPKTLVNTPNPTVLIPALTYVATANAWRRAGWNIHIVDTDYYGVMDLSKIPTDVIWHAICPVGLYGAALTQEFWPGTTALCVEDAAQHWLADDCTRIGSAAAISFDPTKNLGNYGNGGAVITSDMHLAKFAQNWTRNKYSQHWNFSIASENGISTNSRMSEVDCAQMMVKSAYLDKWQEKRKEIAAYWIDKFKDTSVRALIDDTNFYTHCFHKFVIEINDRDNVQKSLAENHIETKVHYADPIQDLPEYQHCNGPDMMSASHALSRRCLSLPLYPELSDTEVEYIATQVINCVS